MAITNQERVCKAMELLRAALALCLAGVDVVLADAGVKSAPTARRVVLVGNKILPGNPITKPDGTVVRTLWGELAYQLGGKMAFARIKARVRVHPHLEMVLRVVRDKETPVYVRRQPPSQSDSMATLLSTRRGLAATRAVSQTR